MNFIKFQYDFDPTKKKKIIKGLSVRSGSLIIYINSDILIEHWNKMYQNVLKCIYLMILYEEYIIIRRKYCEKTVSRNDCGKI